jgi:mannan polymerase II complex MNN11 subunit
VDASSYKLGGSGGSWARIPAMRHAMTTFSESTYFFYLDPEALIMNPSLSLEEHILNVKRLDSLMLRDMPVVPPDSVIKTFSHLKSERVDLVLTQDNDGLGQGSFILRQGEWAHYFLDTWFDPLYRSYNFQRAEGHALVSLLNATMA